MIISDVTMFRVFNPTSGTKPRVYDRNLSGTTQCA